MAASTAWYRIPVKNSVIAVEVPLAWQQLVVGFLISYPLLTLRIPVRRPIEAPLSWARGSVRRFVDAVAAGGLTAEEEVSRHESDLAVWRARAQAGRPSWLPSGLLVAYLADGVLPSADLAAEVGAERLAEVRRTVSALVGHDLSHGPAACGDCAALRSDCADAALERLGSSAGAIWEAYTAFRIAGWIPAVDAELVIVPEPPEEGDCDVDAAEVGGRDLDGPATAAATLLGAPRQAPAAPAWDDLFPDARAA